MIALLYLPFMLIFSLLSMLGFEAQFAAASDFFTELVLGIARLFNWGF